MDSKNLVEVAYNHKKNVMICFKLKADIPMLE
jgi:hypothetical protein